MPFVGDEENSVRAQSRKLRRAQRRCGKFSPRHRADLPIVGTVSSPYRLSARARLTETAPSETICWSNGTLPLLVMGNIKEQKQRANNRL